MVTQRAETALSSGGAGRTDIWSVAVNIYDEAPVLGVGYANFPVAYTADIVRESDVGHLLGQQPAGSWLAQHADRDDHVELGPIGLLLLLLFLGPLVLRRGWGPGRDRRPGVPRLALTSACSWTCSSNRKQVWLIIGVAAGLAYLARPGRLDGRPTSGSDRPAPPEGAPDYPMRDPLRPRPLAGRSRDRVADRVRDRRGLDHAGLSVGRRTGRRASSSRPRRGRSSGSGCATTVVCPTPWAPWPLPRLRTRWRRYAEAPRLATDHGVAVARPALPRTSRANPAGRCPTGSSRARRGEPGPAGTAPRSIHGHSAVTGLAAWRLARRAGLPARAHLPRQRHEHLAGRPPGAAAPTCGPPPGPPLRSSPSARRWPTRIASLTGDRRRSTCRSAPHHAALGGAAPAARRGAPPARPAR